MKGKRIFQREKPPAPSPAAGCENCGIADSCLKGAASNPYMNLEPVHALLSSLLEEKRLELYAGDCPFEDMMKVLSAEEHFTVCFYLRCPKCGEIYFFGACIRGMPVYKKADDLTDEEIRNLLWGKEGSYFQSFK